MLLLDNITLPKPIQIDSRCSNDGLDAKFILFIHFLDTYPIAVHQYLLPLSTSCIHTVARGILEDESL